MRQLSFITTAEESASKREPIVLKSSAIASSSVAPYFVEYVKQQLIDRLGAERVFTGGLRITTTLVPGLQTAAEQAGRASLPSTSDPETAIVVLDPRDGGILAMVGGRDFARAQYNLAAQGRRQPGSAFKPFLLVAALEKGVSPDRTFQTAPFSVRVKDGVWNVENYENGFTSGAITLRTATDWSVNGVFARLVMEIGAQRVVDAAKRMGITSPLEPNPAIALGGLSHGVSPLEMASAYGTLATGGVQTPPLAVTKVTDDRGRIVYEGKPKPVRVVSKQVSSTASGMLREVVDRGTGLNARIARPASGKTGTTQSYRDAWFVGYTGDLVAAVWVGYRQAQVAMTNIHGIKVTGGSFPAIIWARLAGSPAGLLAAEGKSAAPRAEAASEVATLGVGVTDSSLVRVRICQDSLMRANPRCPRVVEMDLPAYAVPPVCTVH